VEAIREQRITPHVAQKKKGSAIDRRTARHAGSAVSLKIHKRVEEAFGLAKVKAQMLFTVAAYNLTCMATIFGWRLSTA
jgi:IS5 family transposase